MKKYARRRFLSRKVKFIVILICIIIIIVGGLVFFKANINPIVISICESKINTLTTQAINRGIFSTLGEAVNYTDLVDVVTDNSGKITLIKANAMKINQVASLATKRCETELQLIKGQSIEIPVGSLTGAPLLSGHGPEISVEILPYGSVSVKFISEFEEAGINQTRHKIYLEVDAMVSLIMPVTDTSIQTRTQVLICESILIGDVPNVYAKFDGGSGLLNLVPK